jgi:hypothetical protein
VKSRTSKDIRLYDALFPIWFILLLPPVIFISLGGDLVIDSAVILIAFALIKDRAARGYTVWGLFKSSILKVWLLGFAADIISAGLLLVFDATAGSALPYNVSAAVNGNPFANVSGFLIVMFFIALGALLIFLFNYYITFRKKVSDRALRFRLSLAVAVITAPWTFLVPSSWLYR